MAIKAKIEGTDEAWESGALGEDEAHVAVAPDDLEAEIDAALGITRKAAPQSTRAPE